MKKGQSKTWNKQQLPYGTTRKLTIWSSYIVILLNISYSFFSVLITQEMIENFFFQSLLSVLHKILETKHKFTLILCESSDPGIFGIFSDSAMNFFTAVR